MLRAVDTSKAVLAAVLPVYLIILAGALLRKLRVLKVDQDEPVFRLVFSVLYPCFILDKILGSESVRNGGDVIWGIGLGFGLTVLGFAGAWLLAGLLQFQKGSGKRTFTLATGVQNFGYTAIPVVELMWAGTGAIAMLFVHNLGVELAIWSVGVMILSGEKTIPWKKLVNGPVISVLLGLVLVGSGLDRYLETAGGHPVGEPMRRAMAWIGAGAFPVALLITGALVSDLIGAERPSPKIVLSGVVVRLAVLPMLLLAAAKFLPAPLALKQVLVVQAAMPSAMTPIMLAKVYGGRPGVAVQIVIATTVVSLFTLPFVIIWGRQWAGL
ncbi:AEC family transporter [Luteolibacter arcticus]|uniref:AEC family transporter n=1 Tax=Luteolibacter arcticus TaxID=1581411 RepID=A0ABT3GKJ8_9BACT|nr:AEC family transporter [Luteolibacter arcticus]MCW1924045.1 AEC family transporter [Luteolibacter arcticus]